jgi:hypothetical protein
VSAPTRRQPRARRRHPNRPGRWPVEHKPTGVCRADARQFGRCVCGRLTDAHRPALSGQRVLVVLAALGVLTATVLALLAVWWSA